MCRQHAIPFNPMVPLTWDATSYLVAGTSLVPVEYTGWRSESMAWKESAYLGTSLAVSPTYVVKGPDAERFFSENFVNDFSGLTVGGSRHGIMCDDQGRIMMDGVVMRTGPDEFYTCWLAPYIEYALSIGDYDATGEDVTGQRFLFQVAGPRSLEIIERALDADLHDIRFGRHRTTPVADGEVRVYRLGMAGGLSYEVHGPGEIAQEVYKAIWEAGKGFGMKRLGQRAYMLNHTEDGFPQAYYHFPYPWYEDAGFAAWLDKRPGAGMMEFQPHLRGSMGDDISRRYVTPFDCGWEGRIHWDHEFTGKAALQRLAQSPARTVVTLEWNTEDVADIYASQFRDEEPYAPIDERPNDMWFEIGLIDPITGQPNTHTYHADKVLKDGVEMGFSSGRSISQTYRRMISLGFIDRSLTAIGTEVTLLWGAPGTRQKVVRATVERFPYLQIERNHMIDVNTIPRLAAAGA